MKKSKETIKTYFETGDKPTQDQYKHLIDSYIDAKQSEGEPNRRFVINDYGEVDIASKLKIPEYTLSEITENKLSLLKDGVIVKEIDLNSLKETVPQYQEGNNITIDNTDPLNPVINSLTKDSGNTDSLVPYQGANKNIDLVGFKVNLGEVIEDTKINTTATLLTYVDTPVFNIGVSYWNGSSYTTPFLPSLGLGYFSLSKSIGQRNNAFGGFSGYLIEGSYNTLAGGYTGYNLKGSYNSIFGQLSGRYTTGNYNLIMGKSVGTFVSGNKNVYLGTQSAKIANGDGNVCIGDNSGNYLQGDNNIRIGSIYSSDEKNSILLSTLPSDEHYLNSTTLTDRLVMTIPNHGYPVGKRFNFKYRPDTVDPPASPLNSNINSGSIFSMYVTNENTLTGENITYIKPSGENITGTHIFTRVADINNSITIGHSAVSSKSNQMVLGNDKLEEVYTKATVKAEGYNINSIQTPPLSSSDTGTTGEIRITNTGVYICISTNTWIKTQLDSAF